MTRRVVRVDPQFFAELDAQLGDARGPNGEPSSRDFLLIDLPPIADAFAESFDEVPAMFTGREDYRWGAPRADRAAGATAHLAQRSPAGEALGVPTVR